MNKWKIKAWFYNSDSYEYVTEGLNSLEEAQKYVEDNSMYLGHMYARAEIVFEGE